MRWVVAASLMLAVVRARSPTTPAALAGSAGVAVGVVGGPSAMTTPPPVVEDLRQRLAGRDLPVKYDTCGFADGVYQYPYYCNTGACMWNSKLTRVGCCPTTGPCDWFTSCVDFASQRDHCDDSCMANPSIYKCDPVRSLCDTYTMNPGSSYLHYNCVVQRSPYNIQLTVSGRTLVESALPRFGTAFGVSATDEPAATRASSPSASSGTQTPTPSGQSSQPGKKSVGPIVGGVIGGVIFVALVALGVYFLGRRAGAKSNPRVAPATQVQYTYLGQPELEGRDARERQELVGRQLAPPNTGFYELTGQPRAYEIDTRHRWG